MDTYDMNMYVAAISIARVETVLMIAQQTKSPSLVIIVSARSGRQKASGLSEAKVSVTLIPNLLGCCC